ncbi:MAG: hypothetical protein KDB14_32025 [Planctomycetales bacterium]|nr:hypothetical protein [Planctomycetales bacterium]
MYASVYLIAALFLVLQIGMFLTLKIRLDSVRALFQSLIHGSDARVSAKANSCRWISWVNRVLPPQAASDDSGASDVLRGDWSRDHAESELNHWLASNQSLQALQRTAIAAPMIGVVITVLAFWTVDFTMSPSGGNPSADSTASAAGAAVSPAPPSRSMREIMRAMRPLFTGVFSGAVLALVNQGLLYLATNKISELRDTAMLWFDTKVWTPLTADGIRETQNAGSTLSLVADTVLRSAKEHQASERQFLQSMNGLRQTLAEFDGTVQAAQTTLGSSLEGLAQVAEKSLTFSETVASLATQSEAAAGLISSAGQAFQVAVDNNFLSSVKQHQEAVQQFGETATTLSGVSKSLSEFTAQLAGETSKITQATALHAEAATALDEVVRQQMAPAVEALHNSTTATQDGAEAMSKGLAGVLDRAQTRIQELEAALGTLGSTAQKFAAIGEIEKKLTPFLDSLRAAAETSQQLIQWPLHVEQSLKATSEKIDQGTTDQLRKVEREMKSLSDAMLDLPKSLHNSLTDLQAGLLTTARETMAADVKALNQTTSELRELPKTIRSVLEQLSQQIQTFAVEALKLEVEQARDLLADMFKKSSSADGGAQSLSLTAGEREL